MPRTIQDKELLHKTKISFNRFNYTLNKIKDKVLSYHLVIKYYCYISLNNYIYQ